MMEEVTTKKCTHCGKVLPIERFGLCKKSYDGHQSWCRDCHANWHIKNRKKKDGARNVTDESIPGECVVLPMAEHQPKMKMPEAFVSKASMPLSVGIVQKDMAKLTVKDATPRELMAELKKRGYVWSDMTYTEVHHIRYDSI